MKNNSDYSAIIIGAGVATGSALTKKFANNAQLKIVLNKFDTRTALSSEVLSTLLNDDILKTLLFISTLLSNHFRCSKHKLDQIL